MASSRPAGSRSQPMLFGAIALAAAGSAALVGGRAVVHRLDPIRAATAIPGVTIEDDAAMPVVTSLRSDCEAQRRGLRVGDHIDAVNGERVRDAAELRHAVDAGGGARAVALHVRRGDALWTVTIDRTEPPAAGAERHDPQDPAG